MNEEQAVDEIDDTTSTGTFDEGEREAGTTDRYPKSIIREYFESIVVTFIMALFGMTFLTQAVKVPTGSMLNTILVEDHLLVNKFVYGTSNSVLDWALPYREIRRGDIIVFKYPVNPEENFVKRVIGLPGETIEIRGTKVLINGEELPENKFFAQSIGQIADLVVDEPAVEAPGAQWSVYYTFPHPEDGEAGPPRFRPGNGFGPADSFGEDRAYVIPEGCYFCMGDNRDRSLDSRSWGPVPRENVLGRAMFVYWSIDEAARQPEFHSEPMRRSLPGNIVDLFRYTRWDRTGTFIR
jgi:signal peptidase I